MNLLEERKESDWVCVELVGGRRIFTRLPFDPFGDPPDPIPEDGHINLEHAFVVAKSMGPQGNLQVGIMGFDDPPEVLEAPYKIDMRHVQMIAKMSEDSPLYQEFRNRVSPIDSLPAPQLIVPA